ncbi:hypothetical protein BJ165DRAFT_1528271 [Panaeolus papilionaceus]|nr:hypothetical protein BJ165DRAFT_1528271 [Panaeolus papilionaceus]
MNSKCIYDTPRLTFIRSDEWKHSRQFWRLTVALLAVLVVVCSSISLACLFCLWSDDYHHSHTGLAEIIRANSTLTPGLDVQLEGAPTSNHSSVSESVDEMQRIESMIFNYPFDGLARYNRLMVVDLREADLPTICRTYPTTEIPLLEMMLGFAYPRCFKVASDLRARINHAQNLYIESTEGSLSPVDLLYLAIPVGYDANFFAWLDDLKDQLRRDGWIGVKASPDSFVEVGSEGGLLPDIEEIIMRNAQAVIQDLISDDP